MTITGAGVSLASGIPTYRDNAGKWKRSDPIKHQEFINDIQMRQRYWARSMVGWRAVANAQPNCAHKALARLEQRGFINTIVTQNVDGLHNIAGSKEVIDLHGRLDEVICMKCSNKSSRALLQPRLNSLNPRLNSYVAQILPDGDASIDDYAMETIKIPECLNCGGILKPDVVFFGDNVPKARVKKAMSSLKSAGGLLLIGSSLQVYSGYRFCKAAAEWGVPIGCINPGVTRADEMLTYKWNHDCTTLLNHVQAKIT